MKRLFFLLFLIFSFLTYGKVQKPIEAALTEILIKEWQPFASQIPEKNIGVAIAIYQPNKHYFASTGFTQPFDQHTKFRGASTTKTFTGAAILKLHQDGKLNINHTLDDVIPNTTEKYLPETANYQIPFRKRITIKQLLAHRAGVFDITNSNIPDNIKAPYAGKRYIDYIEEKRGGRYAFTKPFLIEPVAKHQLLYFEPGDNFHYSNTGYGILGLIIERVSGLSLSQYKQHNFIEPLALNETEFVTTPQGTLTFNPRIDSFTKMPSGLVKNQYDNLSSAQAEGNIVTSMYDLAKWGYDLYATDTILNPSVRKTMTTMKKNDDALVYYGLACEGNPPAIGVGHSGARVGTLIVMRYDKKTDAVYVVKSNLLDRSSKQNFMAENVLFYRIIEQAQKLLAR